jgi:carboxymethylenebutenolidase
MNYEGQLAETVSFPGHHGDVVDGYYARPLGPGPHPGLVVIHHAPGLDEETLDVVRRLAGRGYATLAPHLYTREARAQDTDSETAAKIVRENGGLADDQMLGDVGAAVARLRTEPYSSGRVGVLGFCSGGRQAYLVACQVDVAAAVDCYGGSVIAGPERLTPSRPVAPIDLTASLSCPLLGIFGGADPHVPREHIDAIEAAAKQHGKSFEYHVYEDAPHAFLGHQHVSYRVREANDAWRRIFRFLDDTLRG